MTIEMMEEMNTARMDQEFALISDLIGRHAMDDPQRRALVQLSLIHISEPTRPY